jgi:beta-phosphoglucomutase-like phosphatase (HAD superfamily)
VTRDGLDGERFKAVLFATDGVLTSTSNGVSGSAGLVRWLEHLRRAGKRTAVVSSSCNGVGVLDGAGISALFDAHVDAHDIERLGLRGRPAPDRYLEAASRLTVHPMQAVLVEDALAGVAAGRTGGFGLVIGVASKAARAELCAAGAHLVVDDLEELVE